jgi:hypothetical protein
MAKPKISPDPIRTTDSATQPFGFEIRIRGRLDKAQWADWFENLNVSAAKGGTRLSGALPDHAALYALLSRLRDMAVPLLSVTVLDAAEERTMRRLLQRQTLAVNLILLGAYGLLTGGVAAWVIFLSESGWIHTSFAIALLFAALGIFAFVFSLWSGFRPWRWLAFGLWPAALLVFLIYASQTELLPTSIVVAIILSGLAGGALVVAQCVRSNRERLSLLLKALPDRKEPAPGAGPPPPPPSPRGTAKENPRRKR